MRDWHSDTPSPARPYLDIRHLHVIIFFRKLFIIKYPSKIIVLLFFVYVEYFKIDCFWAEVRKLVVKTNFVIANFLERKTWAHSYYWMNVHTYFRLVGMRSVGFFKLCKYRLSLRVDNSKIDIELRHLPGASIYDLVLHGESVGGRNWLEETFLLARVHVDSHLPLQTEGEVGEDGESQDNSPGHTASTHAGTRFVWNQTGG